MLAMPDTEYDTETTPAALHHATALRFDGVAVLGARISFEAHAGELVHLAGGPSMAQWRALAIASGHSFRGGGRCLIDGRDTNAITAAERTALRQSFIARVLVSDTLPAGMTLLMAVAQEAVRRGLPAAVAMHRAALELDGLGLGTQQSLPPHLLTPAQARLAVLARALVCRPALLLLERPETGLDEREVAALRVALLSLAANAESCVVMTTAHARLAASADRRVALDAN